MMTDLPHVVPEKREPSWSDAAFVAVCVLAAGLLFLVLLGLPFEAIGSEDRAARQRFTTALMRLPVVLWLLLAVLPVVAMIIYRKLRGVLAGIRSLVAGVTGASMTGIGLFFALLGFSQTVIEPVRLEAEEALFAVILLTVAGLIAGTGASLWMHAVRIAGGSDAAPRLVAGAAVWAGIAMAVSLGPVIAALAGELAHPKPDLGVLTGAWLSIGLCVVWLYTFVRLAGFGPTPVWRSLVAIAGLAVIIVISFALPAYLAALSFYAVFAVFIAAPVSGLIALLVATLGLSGLRRFLRA